MAAAPAYQRWTCAPLGPRPKIVPPALATGSTPGLDSVGALDSPAKGPEREPTRGPRMSNSNRVLGIAVGAGGRLSRAFAPPAASFLAACPGGGTVDAVGLNPTAREGVGVRLPPRALGRACGRARLRSRAGQAALACPPERGIAVPLTLSFRPLTLLSSAVSGESARRDPRGSHPAGDGSLGTHIFGWNRAARQVAAA